MCVDRVYDDFLKSVFPFPSIVPTGGRTGFDSQWNTTGIRSSVNIFSVYICWTCFNIHPVETL